MTLDYDPLQPTCWQDPYPTYQRLRDEAPIHFSQKDAVYTVSRYEDVSFVLRNAELFSSKAAFDILTRDLFSRLGLRGVFEAARFVVRSRMNPLRTGFGPPEMLITTDPPRHDDLRSIVNRTLSPRRVQDWEPRLGEIVDSCTTKLKRGEPFDVVRDLSIPLPVTAIAEMIGIDPARKADFKRWSDAFIAGASGSTRTSDMAPFFKAMGELRVYLREMVRQRRSEPRDDLISVLVDPRHGATLDDYATIEFVFLLLIAGNETTTNWIGNAVKALLANPQELSRLGRDPSQIPNMLEEALRYDAPVQYVLRRATQDAELPSGVIPKDATVAVLLGSANRDERQFEDPDVFRIDRVTKGHLSFGFGVHFCLGASLARLEARIALEALLPTLTARTHPPVSPALVDSFLVRGPLEIQLQPSRVAA